MSSAHRAARPLVLGRRERGVATPGEASRLVVVPRTTARASSGTFALFVGAILTLGLLGLLALNTLLAQGAFATSDLAKKQAALADREQALQQDVALLQAPEQLAVAAQSLGMVDTKNPVFLDPVTGKILGVPLAGAHRAPKVQATPLPAASATTLPTTGPTTGPTTKPTTGATTKPTTNPSPTPSKPAGTR